MNARLIDDAIPRLELLPISSPNDTELPDSKKSVSLVYYAELTGRFGCFDAAISEASGKSRDLLIYYVLLYYCIRQDHSRIV